MPDPAPGDKRVPVRLALSTSGEFAFDCFASPLVHSQEPDPVSHLAVSARRCVWIDRRFS